MLFDDGSLNRNQENFRTLPLILNSMVENVFPKFHKTSLSMRYRLGHERSFRLEPEVERTDLFIQSSFYKSIIYFFMAE